MLRNSPESRTINLNKCASHRSEISRLPLSFGHGVAEPVGCQEDQVLPSWELQASKLLEVSVAA